MVASPYTQHGYRLRFEWGLGGAREIAAEAAIVAVIDEERNARWPGWRDGDPGLIACRVLRTL